MKTLSYMREVWGPVTWFIRVTAPVNCNKTTSTSNTKIIMCELIIRHKTKRGVFSNTLWLASSVSEL